MHLNQSILNCCILCICSKNMPANCQVASKLPVLAGQYFGQYFFLAGTTVGFAKKGHHWNCNSYVGSMVAKPTFSNWSSPGMEQSSLHRAVTTNCPPINESHDGLPHARHYEFISWKPTHLKIPIGFNHLTLLIKPIRCAGFNHPQPANTGTTY
jgi:hypothetical protein